MSALAVLGMTAAGCRHSVPAGEIAGELENNVLQAHAFVDVWTIRASDAAANGAPAGKKVTVIGDIKSIPVTSAGSRKVKDYAEYRKTETPAWYNADNVTREEILILTGDSLKELRERLIQKTTSASSASVMP